MLAKKFFSLLLFSLFFSIAGDQGQAQFELASVRAKDLRKLAVDVQPGASLEGLNQVVEPAPLPDGTKIASIERLRVGVESLLYGVYVSSASGGKKSKIAEAVNCFGLAWSPDSSKIAFSEGTIMHIADSDRQTRQAIYVGPGGPYPGACFNLTWSADGQKLSFVQVENARDVDLANPKRVTITLGTVTER